MTSAINDPDGRIVRSTTVYLHGGVEMEIRHGGDRAIGVIKGQEIVLPMTRDELERLLDPRRRGLDLDLEARIQEAMRRADAAP